MTAVEAVVTAVAGHLQCCPAVFEEALGTCLSYGLASLGAFVASRPGRKMC